jgi:hypothetical protein
MSESDISIDVPIPPARQGYAPGIRLSDLLVGHSKVVAKTRRGSLSTAIRRQKFNAPGQNFTTRVEGDKIRVWRIA